MKVSAHGDHHSDVTKKVKVSYLTWVVDESPMTYFKPSQRQVFLPLGWYSWNSQKLSPSRIARTVVQPANHCATLQHFAPLSFSVLTTEEVTKRYDNIWATPWENVSTGVSDQARHKPARAATEAARVLKFWL